MTTKAITPLRQRMIEDMSARKLCAGTQRGHILACKRFAAFLKRSPDTARGCWQAHQIHAAQQVGDERPAKQRSETWAHY